MILFVIRKLDFALWNKMSSIEVYVSVFCCMFVKLNYLLNCLCLYIYKLKRGSVNEKKKHTVRTKTD